MLAVQREDAPMVDLLLRSGANAKAVNRYGVTPALHRRAEQQCMRSLKSS